MDQNMEVESSSLCILCNKDIFIEDHSVLTSKGAESINTVSAQYSRNILVQSGQSVHNSCRRKFTDKRKSTQDVPSGTSSVAKRSHRLAYGQYDASTDCLFCGTVVDFGKRHGPSPFQAHKVSTSEFAESIKQCCHKRADEWSFLVIGRIEYFQSDLHAADCVYHHACSTHFRSGRNVPFEKLTDQTVTHKLKSGRPENEEQRLAFQQTCSYIENYDDEQLTISDIQSTMERFLEGTDSAAYSAKYLKRKLIDFYGENLEICSKEGEPDIFCFKETSDHILRSYYRKNKDVDVEMQKVMIIEAAAKIIQSDIKCQPARSKDNYPTTTELSTEEGVNYLPHTLKVFLNLLFVGINTATKVASVGQSIMQSVRPRSIIAPFQIGLAVQLHHHFRSRFLIDMLFGLGFASSYAEVQKFERNAAVMLSTDLPGLTQNLFVLMAADNVDHNICTLDGRNTVHAMGIIAAVTSGSKMVVTLPRMNITNSQLLAVSRITIHDYDCARTMLTETKFLPFPPTQPRTCYYDLLWQISRKMQPERPNWSGFMEIITKNQNSETVGKSSVKFLPIIDLEPGNMSCILSTMMFVLDLANCHNVIPVLTFDQPLFWKSSKIQHQYPILKSVCLMLGNFHTVMNLLGAIGTLMDGSGITELLEEVYAENAVSHILTGKAYSRAVRGHLILDAALNDLQVERTFPASDDMEMNSILHGFLPLYNSIVDNIEVTENLETVLADSLRNVGYELDKERQELCQSSRTCKLWLEYQSVVATIRKLIHADRIGSLELHKEGLSEALPIFAAAGHSNYTKSTYLHLQNMINLNIHHPELYAQFKEGRHVIRRTDKSWNGLPADLVIEQTLMRSLKSSGGLTRGSGMSEIQRSIWLLSLPVTAEYNCAMQEVAQVMFHSSEQHKDLSKSRKARDQADTDKLLQRLRSISPFNDDPSLRNIATGVTAAGSVNVDNFIALGRAMVNKMQGENVFSFVHKRSDKVKTIASVSKIEVPNETVKIDPALMFQRLYVLALSNEIDLEQTLKHELCSYPPALFERPSVPLKADKPQLAKAIIDHAMSAVMDNAYADVDEQHTYVLDGGSLIHRLPWSSGTTYADIAKSYVTLVVAKYGRATVVFDGYSSGPSIKDMTHNRRVKHVGFDVTFTPTMVFTGKKEIFLSNKCNKQRIIDLLSVQLKNEGCSVIQAREDADVDIVQACMESAQTIFTILIGEDTDLLILLLYHFQDSMYNILFRSDVKRPHSVQPNRIYNIRLLQRSMEKDVVKSMLFLHAFTGCDSTSRIHSVGKKRFFTRYWKTRSFVVKPCRLLVMD